MKLSDGNCTLVFEDDAVPNRDDCLEIARQCIPLLDKWDIVSLHGRSIVEESSFEYCGYQFIIPAFVDVTRYVHGSLAYLVSRATRERIIADEYSGCPMDLYISTCFRTCVIANSPWDHDRQFGSLTENPVVDEPEA